MEAVVEDGQIHLVDHRIQGELEGARLELAGEVDRDHLGLRVGVGFEARHGVSLCRWVMGRPYSEARGEGKGFDGQFGSWLANLTVIEAPRYHVG